MIRKFLLLIAAIMTLTISEAQEIKDKKIYDVRFMPNAPYGVTAWAQSAFVKDAKNKEDRFVDYNSDAAKGLINDATAVRDVEKDATVAVR